MWCRVNLRPAFAGLFQNKKLTDFFGSLLQQCTISFLSHGWCQLGNLTFSWTGHFMWFSWWKQALWGCATWSASSSGLSSPKYNLMNWRWSWRNVSCNQAELNVFISGIFAVPVEGLEREREGVPSFFESTGMFGILSYGVWWGQPQIALAIYLQSHSENPCTAKQISRG